MKLSYNWRFKKGVSNQNFNVVPAVKIKLNALNTNQDRTGIWSKEIYLNWKIIFWSTHKFKNVFLKQNSYI